MSDAVMVYSQALGLTIIINTNGSAINTGNNIRYISERITKPINVGIKIMKATNDSLLKFLSAASKSL
jgi:hypothetical protein